MVDTLYNLLALCVVAFMVGIRVGYGAGLSEGKKIGALCRCRHTVLTKGDEQ